MAINLCSMISMNMTSSIAKILFILGLLSMITDCAGNAGNQFRVGILHNRMDQNHQLKLLFVSTSQFDVLGNATTKTERYDIRVPANEFEELELQIQTIGATTNNKNVLISTSDYLTVYGIVTYEGALNGYLAIPFKCLGKVYRACACHDCANMSHMVIIGTEGYTDVTISISPFDNLVKFRGDFYRSGDTISFRLHLGRLIRIESIGDLTGSRVVATKPVSFFSGNAYQTGKRYDFCSHVAHILPVHQWGNYFIIVGTRNASVKVISDIPVTFVKYICTGAIDQDVASPVSKVYRVDYVLELAISDQSACTLSAHDNVMVVIFPVVRQGSAMILVPARKHYQTNYTFVAPTVNNDTSSLEFTLVFVVQSAAISDLRLDGSMMPDSVTYIRVPDWSYVAGHVRLSPGRHTITDGDHTFMALLYGTSSGQIFGFPLGMQLVESLQDASTVPGDMTSSTESGQSSVSDGSAVITTSLGEDTTVQDMTRDPLTMSTNSLLAQTLNKLTTQRLQTSTDGLTTQSTNTQMSSTDQFTTAGSVIQGVSTGTARDISTEATTPEEGHPSEVPTLKPALPCSESCVHYCKATEEPNSQSSFVLERVDRKQTSKYRCSVTSAHDGRLSVVICGSVAAAIILGLFFTIVMLDLGNLTRMFRQIKENIT